MNSASGRQVQRRLPLPQRILFWVRRGIWIYAVLAVVYLWWRFDLQNLPADGVTPLMSFRPGAHLLVDRQDLDAREGNAMLFHDDQGRLLLGRVGRAPAGETRSGLWILADNPDVVLPDSRTLGPIEEKQIVGRVLCALPGLE